MFEHALDAALKGPDLTGHASETKDEYAESRPCLTSHLSDSQGAEYMRREETECQLKFVQRAVDELSYSRFGSPTPFVFTTLTRTF